MRISPSMTVKVRQHLEQLPSYSIGPFIIINLYLIISLKTGHPIKEIEWKIVYVRGQDLKADAYVHPRTEEILTV